MLLVQERAKSAENLPARRVAFAESHRCNMSFYHYPHVQLSIETTSHITSDSNIILYSVVYHKPPSEPMCKIPKTGSYTRHWPLGESPLQIAKWRGAAEGRLLSEIYRRPKATPDIGH